MKFSRTWLFSTLVLTELLGPVRARAQTPAPPPAQATLAPTSPEPRRPHLVIGAGFVFRQPVDLDTGRTMPVGVSYALGLSFPITDRLSISVDLGFATPTPQFKVNPQFGVGPTVRIAGRFMLAMSFMYGMNPFYPPQGGLPNPDHLDHSMHHSAGLSIVPVFGLGNGIGLCFPIVYFHDFTSASWNSDHENSGPDQANHHQVDTLIFAMRLGFTLGSF